MKKILCLAICLIFACGMIKAADNRFVVVIDAGHGGKDGGAIRDGYKEKDINLGVALALGRMIEDNYKNVKVIFTRKTDVFVDLDRRAQIANKAKANLFICIHTNSTAAKTTAASGADSYILGLARTAESLAVAKRENSVILLEDDYTRKYEGFDPNSPESYIIFEFMTYKFMEQSLQFSTFVQDAFKSVAKRADRGVRQAGFLVLRKTTMPGSLIELGFINNSEEARFLVSKNGQKAMASAIFSGFRKYKREFDKKQAMFPLASNAEETDKWSQDGEDGGDTLTSDKGVDPLDTISPEPISNTSPKEVKAKVEIEYRVQFLVSPTLLKKNSAALKGLAPVSYYKDANGYKYTYGSTTSFSEIVKIQNQVKTKFKDAFVVRFKNGERVR